MEKFKEIYFYIQTKAYKANTDERADPEIAQRFYEETREIFWNLGFTLGRDYIRIIWQIMKKRFLKPLKAAVTWGWVLGWIVLSSLWKAILFCAEDIIRRVCISSVFLKWLLIWKKRAY